MRDVTPSTGVEDRIETFLRTRFTISPSDPSFGWNVNIYEQGYVDSVGVIELIAFLGQEFDVEVPEDDLLSDEFATVVGIARIVRRLREEGNGRPA
jgi:acyl carrier protein